MALGVILGIVGILVSVATYELAESKQQAAYSDKWKGLKKLFAAVAKRRPDVVLEADRKVLRSFETYKGRIVKAYYVFSGDKVFVVMFFVKLRIPRGWNPDLFVFEPKLVCAVYEKKDQIYAKVQDAEEHDPAEVRRLLMQRNLISI